MSIVIYRQLGLTDHDTNGQTSSVGETSMANSGRHIFMTGNWFASESMDRGSSWDFVSPTGVLPRVNNGFCCDQSVIYEPTRKIMVWVLQYSHDSNTNTLRLAVKRGGTPGNQWHWWDFTPQGINNSWSGEWFDYNHVAVSDNYLYVGTNVFSISGDLFTRSVILRFPLDDLADGGSLSFSYFMSTDNFSLRCVNGAKDVMYFASHNNTRQLRLFEWAENATSINVFDINVSRWSSNQFARYSAPDPDNQDWLGRCDPRITAAWVAKGVIGLAWTANSRGSRPFPHIRAVRIDENSKNVIDEPDIWHPDYAFAYPAVYPNGRGMVGLSAFRGGGSKYPGHIVGVLNDQQAHWQLKLSRSGSPGPVDGKWGDYVNIFPYSGRGFSWFASGFTLQGGGRRQDIEPQVVQFYAR